MNKQTLVFIILTSLLFAGCNSAPEQKNTETMGIISQASIEQAVSGLESAFDASEKERIQKGVAQVAAFWKEEDGSSDDFLAFCQDNFKGNGTDRDALFEKLSRNFEQIWGHYNQLNLELNKALHLDQGPIESVDIMFGSYSPSAHLTDDFFKNKIAFLTMLNFPSYSLQEKADKAGSWSRRDWAYARMGDIYKSRVPAAVNQHASVVSTASDNYISEYNIVMGKVIDNQNQYRFPENMRLITHWGLRDEIKSNYGLADGIEKQRLIYMIMSRIINQDIPQIVINNDQVSWNPYSNQVSQDGQILESSPEPLTRYQHLLDNFHAARAADPYSPNYPTAIHRAFDQGLELSMEEVEALFIELVSSPVLKDVAQLISQRLGRPLEPFDIWYDGFKSRSSISEEQLDKTVNSRYPTSDAFQSDLPVILTRLGWNKNRADEIASKIVVEGSRGAGHAWGAAMRSQKSHLRTRIGKNGMDYKGYNIAIHEFGHNVEQTISLHDVDHFMMTGVPNTAFTEALAFIFQSRDLELLDIPETDARAANLKILDKLWGTYEIMGVSLVDMAVWKWMYANPDATPEMLRQKTLDIAYEVWNTYYEPVIGVGHSHLLAIYSHMISYPLYLSAYPIGLLIEFQLEKQFEGKSLASETDRVFGLGRLIPQQWMLEATGEKLSAQPMITAAAEALKNL